MKIQFILTGIFVVSCGLCSTYCEPVVIPGRIVPSLCGKQLSAIRVIRSDGKPVPFQIDEVTDEGEFVCPSGEQPNSGQGNGVLDPQDEIVFLREDTEPISSLPAQAVSKNSEPDVFPVRIRDKKEERIVFCTANRDLPLSSVSYIRYDHEVRKVTARRYYAVFGAKRFHFTAAGIVVTGSNRILHLTDELRVRILLRLRIGSIPIEYDEQNMICSVIRYKAGPIRLIRRGDFHLKLGLFLKGSRAAVHQICYPDMVRVPVTVHIPIRFSFLFREAFIEMTPVFRLSNRSFQFFLPGKTEAVPLDGSDSTTLFFRENPNNRFFLVHNTTQGYGWLCESSIPDSFLTESGYVFQRPSRRPATAHCGFRLSLRELPRGYYLITNWVVFSDRGMEGLTACYRRLQLPSTISGQSGKEFRNGLFDVKLSDPRHE